MTCVRNIWGLIKMGTRARLLGSRVLMLGSSAVGKSSLVSQFMTSEYLHAYDTSIGKLHALYKPRMGLCICAVCVC